MNIKNKISAFNKKLKKGFHIAIGRMRNIRYVPPNYIFRGNFQNSSVIVDVGCGFDADFSESMINKYGLKAFGIDPTLKHKESLDILSKKMNGRFSHRLIAVSSVDGKIIFNESENNVSGSILKDHKNVKNDKIKKYEVDSVSLSKLPEHLDLPKIEYIKLDLEGAEYELINNLKKSDLEKYEQIFVEFHHHCVPGYTPKKTLECVRKVASYGFKYYTLDNHNFLFYKTK